MSGKLMSRYGEATMRSGISISISTHCRSRSFVASSSTETCTASMLSWFAAMA
ncbi:hypothetical protein CMMCAS03_06485 [Clavibacter michiganensis subsp. michiganensis]|nr:hypothetical protein CMMCAS03_06485 [Clavibacter michiganensis subsp. michiganensis]